MSEVIYLTFDFDWANEEIIKELWDFLLTENVRATFFITNEFKDLKTFYRDYKGQFEFGIHPNFTPIPQDEIYHSDFISNCDCILRDLLEIIPDARTVRSHGLTVNTRVLNLFRKYGITRESNIYIPKSSGVIINAWHHYNDLIRIPFYFEDDLYCEELNDGGYKEEQWDASGFFDNGGLKVFDFHPIHFKLNTESMERYYRYKTTNEIMGNINSSEDCGSRIFLKRVIKYAKENGYRFGTLNEIV